MSHLLLADLSWEGAGEAALILLVVWWAWNYTTWVTNELDPDSPIVRLLLMGIMLATLLMAVAIPDAFGSRGLLFACSYVAIQVGRHAFLTFVSARAGTIERERAADILIWFSAAGVFWIAGALVEDDARTALWLVALAIDYFAPIVLYRVPGRPKLAPETWDVETAHFAERFQLFVIIALGESIVLIGATTSDLDIDAARLTALGLAFAGTAALWWLYFDYVAPIAQRRLELAENRTLLARDGYTYLHVLMIAGIIAWAVGDELVIAHPTDELPAAGDRRARVRACDLPARPRALPPADGRDAVLEAPGRRARVRGGRRARPGCARPRALRPARRRRRRRDRRGADRRSAPAQAGRAVAA